MSLEGDVHCAAQLQFPQDVLGVIMSFCSTIDLRLSIVRVCKHWNEIGMETVKGVVTVSLFTEIDIFASLYIVIC